MWLGRRYEDLVLTVILERIKSDANRILFNALTQA